MPPTSDGSQTQADRAMLPTMPPTSNQPHARLLPSLLERRRPSSNWMRRWYSFFPHHPGEARPAPTECTIRRRHQPALQQKRATSSREPYDACEPSATAANQTRTKSRICAAPAGRLASDPGDQPRHTVNLSLGVIKVRAEAQMRPALTVVPQRDDHTMGRKVLENLIDGRE